MLVCRRIWRVYKEFIWSFGAFSSQFAVGIVCYARTTISNGYFIALTFAGSLGRYLNTRPSGLAFKQLPRDPANVNAWKTMDDPYNIIYLRKIPLPTSNFPTKNTTLYHASSVFRFRITILAYASSLVLLWHYMYQTSFYAMELKLLMITSATNDVNNRNITPVVRAFRRNMSKIMNKNEN